jgi:hypothetical protein
VLRIAIPRGGGTPEQMAELGAARKYADECGVTLVIVEECDLRKASDVKFIDMIAMIDGARV